MKQRRILPAAAGGLALLALLWWSLSAAAEVAPAVQPAAPAAPAVTITQTVTLTSAADNTLYESATGVLSNGAGEFFFAGMTQNGEIRRGLLAFDLGAAGIPPGATVLAATLTLTMSRTIAGEAAVSLHAVSADWGEGASDAIGEEGVGAAATTGDATWLHTFFDTGLWTQPGGDFDPAPAATTMVGGNGVYTWASPALSADVAGWLDDPSTNFGWALVGDETTSATAKRFDSRENAPANRPRLTVTYTADVEQIYMPAALSE